MAEVGDAAAIPTTRINAGNQWYAGEMRYDLWGGSNNTEDWYDPNAKGHKTIYDPCPEGYRVPDAKVFKEVGDKALIWETPNGNKNQITDTTNPECFINPDSPFYNAASSKGYSTLAYPLSGGTYDYWPFLGYLADKGSSYTGTGAKSAGSLALLAWANSAPGEAMKINSPRGVALEYAYFSSSRAFNTRHQAFICYAAAVRCQKED